MPPVCKKAKQNHTCPWNCMGWAVQFLISKGLQKEINLQMLMILASSQIAKVSTSLFVTCFVYFIILNWKIGSFMNSKPLTLLFLEGSSFSNKNYLGSGVCRNPVSMAREGLHVRVQWHCHMAPEEKGAMALCLGILSTDSCVWLYKIALLRYKSYAIKFNLFTGRSQWFLVSSQLCCHQHYLFRIVSSPLQ